MKKPFLITFLLLSIILMISCEEDDVCVGEGTPYLTVVFRNNLNTENYSDTFTIYSSSDENFTDETLLYEEVETDSIKLPLGGLNASQTFFKIQRQSNSDSDTLTVNYTTKSEFVSKACGYRITYEDLSYQTTFYHINYLEPSESNVLQDESNTNLYIALSD